jgi:putative transposase
LEEFKTYNHNPPHLFRNSAKYFITASTYRKEKYLRKNQTKYIVLNSIKFGFNRYDWLLEDWVILDNHYHLMVQAKENANKLPKIINDIHKFTTLKLKKEFSELRKKQRIWYNYWDTCITYEKSYFARLNYIWFNPVKHGYTNDPANWKFGSYFERYNTEKDFFNLIVNKYKSDKVRVRDDF